MFLRKKTNENQMKKENKLPGIAKPVKTPEIKVSR